MIPIANTRSALKRTKQNLQRRAQNVSMRSTVKTAIRQFENAVTAGDADAARARLRKASTLLDKAAGKGIIHKNKAARKKSRLTKRLSNLETA